MLGRTAPPAAAPRRGGRGGPLARENTKNKLSFGISRTGAYGSILYFHLVGQYRVQLFCDSARMWSSSGLRICLRGWFSIHVTPLFEPDSLGLVSGPTLAARRSKIYQEENITCQFPS